MLPQKATIDTSPGATSTSDLQQLQRVRSLGLPEQLHKLMDPIGLPTLNILLSRVGRGEITRQLGSDIGGIILEGRQFKIGNFLGFRNQQDALLKALAGVIKECAKRCKCEAIGVRLGGDEIAVLAPKPVLGRLANELSLELLKQQDRIFGPKPLTPQQAQMLVLKEEMKNLRYAARRQCGSEPYTSEKLADSLGQVDESKFAEFRKNLVGQAPLQGPQPIVDALEVALKARYVASKKLLCAMAMKNPLGQFSMGIVDAIPMDSFATAITAIGAGLKWIEDTKDEAREVPSKKQWVNGLTHPGVYVRQRDVRRETEFAAREAAYSEARQQVLSGPEAVRRLIALALQDPALQTTPPALLFRLLGRLQVKDLMTPTGKLYGTEFDLANFGPLNNTASHSEGDRIAGEIAQAATPADALLLRLGGGRFLVVSNQNIAAQKLGERLSSKYKTATRTVNSALYVEWAEKVIVELESKATTKNRYTIRAAITNLNRVVIKGRKVDAEDIVAHVVNS